jgi:O-antigen ligase
MKVTLDNIYTVLFSVLCFSLAFIGDRFYAIPNGINISLVLIFPFLVNKQKFINHIVKKPIVWFAIFLSFVLVKSVLLGHFLEDISVIKKLSQVLLLLILSCGIKPKSTETLKSGVVLGTFIAVIYSIIKIGIIVIQTTTFNFAKGPIINETLPVQRLYLGLLCTISLILVIEKFFKNRQKLNLFLAVLFTLFVFLIAARIAIISVLIVIIYYVFIMIKAKYKYIFLLLIISTTSMVVLLNNNLSKRILHLDDTFRESYVDKIAMHEPRFLIWKYSYEALQSTNLFLGNGFNRTEEKLVSSYKKIPQLKKRAWFINKRFNTHNQYIDIALSQGFIGLSLFLIFLFQLFVIAKKSHSDFLLLLSALIYMLVYNNFHRVIGVYIFSLIFIFILEKSNYQKLKK